MGPGPIFLVFYGAEFFLEEEKHGRSGFKRRMKIYM